MSSIEIVDTEASGLHFDSYPIEIAVSDSGNGVFQGSRRQRVIFMQLAWWNNANSLNEGIGKKLDMYDAAVAV